MRVRRVTIPRSPNVVLRAVVRLPSRVVVLVLRAYRLAVSPLYGQVCRFYPSCSAYALEAVDRHGVVRGGWLTARRLVRCHPWNPGGVDPVPQIVPALFGARQPRAYQGPVDQDPETDCRAPGDRYAA